MIQPFTEGPPLYTYACLTIVMVLFISTFQSKPTIWYPSLWISLSGFSLEWSEWWLLRMSHCCKHLVKHFKLLWVVVKIAWVVYNPKKMWANICNQTQGHKGKDELRVYPSIITGIKQVTWHNTKHIHVLCAMIMMVVYSCCRPHVGLPKRFNCLVSRCLFNLPQWKDTLIYIPVSWFWSLAHSRAHQPWYPWLWISLSGISSG